jgi:hypothetical protein
VNTLDVSPIRDGKDSRFPGAFSRWREVDILVLDGEPEFVSAYVPSRIVVRGLPVVNIMAMTQDETLDGLPLSNLLREAEEAARTIAADQAKRMGLTGSYRIHVEIGVPYSAVPITH